MHYALVFDSGHALYFYVRECAEVFRLCIGGRIKEVLV
jgi:hypothetical protein